MLSAWEVNAGSQAHLVQILEQFSYIDHHISGTRCVFKKK